MNRTILLVGLILVSSVSRAYVLIDDFTVGEHESTVEWPEDMDEYLADGLDRNHVVWGDRFTRFQIASNPLHVPVTLSIGGGQMRVSAPAGMADGLSTELRTEWGLGATQQVIDFSNETEIWIDLQVKKPDGRFADLWSLRAIDAHGVSGTNDGWLFRQGGLRYRKSGFTGNLDWSAISYLRLTQRFTSQGTRHPESYTVTKIYAVPEPATFLSLGAMALGACRRRRPRVG